MKQKDIISYDVETTGLDPKSDFVIQLSLIKIDGQTLKEKGRKDWYIKPKGNYIMSPQAQAVHGISKEFLEDNGVLFESIVDEIEEFIKDCDFLTFNGNRFDIKFLHKEFSLVGRELEVGNRKHFDAYAMEVRLSPRDLGSLYNRYTGQVLENAHNSLADVEATIEVFKKQLETHNLTLQDISEFEENKLLCIEGSFRDAASPGNPHKYVFSYGKYKDNDVYEVYKKDESYFRWFLGTLCEDSKQVLREYFKEIIARFAKEKK